MNIFEEVKDRIDIHTAAEHFELTVRNGMCSCPAHTDRTPSMKLYSDHFHCFSCGAHGDVIKLTQLILGCTPIDAARLLAADFGIVIHDDIKPAYITHHSAAPPVRKVNCKEKEERAYRLLSAYCRYLEDCRTRYAPRTPQDAIHPLFMLSLHQLEQFRYYRDLFIYNDTDERMAFIKEQGTLLERLALFFAQKAA
ncbi:MAG: CHC2 zinc finger domain-containing protein [Porcipelethomonas sp.]